MFVFDEITKVFNTYSKESLNSFAQKVNVDNYILPTSCEEKVKNQILINRNMKRNKVFSEISKTINDIAKKIKLKLHLLREYF